MEEIRAVAKKVGAALQQAGADKAQYTVTQKETHEFNVDGGEFSLFRTLFDNGLSITAYKNRKKGSVSINSFADGDIDNAVENCMKAAESAIADEAYDIAPKQENETFREGAYEPEVDRLFSRTRELMDTIREKHPRIIMEQMIVSHTKRHSIYANTNGTEYEVLGGEYSISLMFSAHEGEQTTSFFGTGVQTDSLDKPFIEVGSIEKDLSDVEAQLHIIPFEGKFEGVAILTPGSLGSFLYSIISNFAADGAILQKTSIWLDKLNTKVADERLTISVNPSDPRICCGERYTADGFRSEDFDLIKDGVLKSFLLSLYVANKTGFERAKNTSFSVVMEGGDTPYADMIKNVKRGIIVGRFSGGQPGSNGEFSGVAKNSFLVEDGEIKGAVTETMINGNLADMLKNIVSISKETVEDGTSVLPYIAVDGIVIAGK